jgi:hypothetical protein
MRQRLPSPLQPFDVAPPHVVEAAKRIFNTVRWGEIDPLGDAVSGTTEYTEPVSGAGDLSLTGAV